MRTKNVYISPYFIGLSLVVILTLSGCGSATKVAKFRANSQHTGVYTSQGLPALQQLKWKFAHVRLNSKNKFRPSLFSKYW